MSERAFILHLKWLEWRYCTKEKEVFNHSNSQLIKELGLSSRTLAKLKKSLVEKGFIKTWQQKVVTSNPYVQPFSHITYYRLLY